MKYESTSRESKQKIKARREPRIKIMQLFQFGIAYKYNRL